MTIFASFVVATFNCGERTAALRRTAVRLADLSCEICVSDGGSVDGTLERLEGLPGVRIVRSGTDRGIYDAWNLALPHVRGRYVAFIGVDDEPRAAFVDAASSVVQSGAFPSVIYGDVLLHRRGRVRHICAPAHPSLFAAARPVFDIPHQGCLNRADLFASQQPFNPDFCLAGDLDFYLRMRREITAARWVRIPQLQADVQEDGLSRHARAVDIYAAEYERIESTHGLVLGYSRMRQFCLAAVVRVPGLFSLLKNLSWALRGTRLPPAQ